MPELMKTQYLDISLTQVETIAEAVKLADQIVGNIHGQGRVDSLGRPVYDHLHGSVFKAIMHAHYENTTQQGDGD